MADIIPTATPPLSRGSSFQRMLELEKRYKLERLHSDQEQPDTLPSTPTEAASPTSSLQLRRANSLSQQQQDLMLKAVRRSIAPPPLSISIPQPNGDRRSNHARARPAVHEKVPEPDPENVDSLQKSVKFLAPDSDEDDESDQSSICHSPSWEVYGQHKKKDKKKEAERKRKAKEQKEQAEREAKAAKKRSSSRLSKVTSLPARQLPSAMERSNSAPVLNSHSFGAPGTTHPMPTVQDDEDYAHPEQGRDLMLRSITPDSNELLEAANNRFLGGLKLQQEREAALQHAFQSQFTDMDGPDPRQSAHRSYSSGPITMTSAPVPGSSSTRNDSRSSRESCPPSASRTPMLRHTSAQQPVGKVPRGREGINQIVANSQPDCKDSPEALLPGSSTTVRGRSDGYVRQHREQSTERALAGLVDEHLVSSTVSSSTRSSYQHTRHSSLTGDVKAATLRMTGHRATSGTRSDSLEHGPVTHGDYFNYGGQSQSLSPGQPLKASSGTTSSVDPKPSLTPSTTLKTMQKPVGSDTSSNTGAAKPRSIKDVARAALHMSPSQTQVPGFRPTVKPPPYYMLRARFSSSSSVSTTSARMTMDTKRAEPSKPATSHPPSGPSAAPNQPGSRVSEGSSSSSNYDDGSPLPSPVTTPDTSRPQSPKGPSREVTTSHVHQTEASTQDDARTLRQVSRAGSSGSSSNVTPRLTQYDADGNEMPPDDRWSRTAIPMDLDFEDSRSSMSDYSDAREEILTSTPDKTNTCAEANDVRSGSRHGDKSHSVEYPHPSKSHSDLDLAGSPVTETVLQKQKPGTPLRSQASEQQEPERPKTAAGGQLLGKQRDDQSARAEDKPRGTEQRKKLRKQKPAQEAKLGKMADADVELIGRADDDIEATAASAGANTSLMTARFMSPIGGFIPSYGFASNPLFVDISQLNKAPHSSDQGAMPVKITATQITFQTQSTAPHTSADGVQAPSKAPAPTTTGRRYETPTAEPTVTAARALPAPVPGVGSRPTQPSRSSTTPVSILKATAPQPALNQGPGLGGTTPPILSAIPKHLQPQNPTRSQALTPPEARMAPIAKMFVECCSCKFYHDMPSKLYECMAKPDAVVEDKLRGISGAITTMVKCPWCHHNMSTSCCAGYAAVVYIKEKLH